ncbi:auxin-responsive protein IAA8-like [Rutidosis leptorrhynchoides]|uniref:auxin-responsive protein IAA8-like n=1 Tax=Rutidosis leptorrhynchoides TaxID=125765 RepID=UPI003A9A6666
MSTPLEHDYIGITKMAKSSESLNIASESDNNNVVSLKATELRLGLPGLCHDLEENRCRISPLKNFVSGAKRGFSDVNFDGLGSKITEQVITANDVEEKKNTSVKAQVVGWPPIRSFRKNTMATNTSKNRDVAEGDSGCVGCLYVKVSMDGAPYLRKVDLKTCKNYTELSKALEKLFNHVTLGQCASNGLRGKQGLTESNLKELLHRDECVLTYEDKDGDWMLVGDVPWEMFVDSCKRLRIMKGSEAIGIAPIAAERYKNKTRRI